MSSGWYILVKGGKTKLYNTKTEKPLYFKNEKENIDYGFILGAEAYTKSGPTHIKVYTHKTFDTIIFM